MLFRACGDKSNPLLVFFTQANSMEKGAPVRILENEPTAHRSRSKKADVLDTTQKNTCAAKRGCELIQLSENEVLRNRFMWHNSVYCTMGITSVFVR